MNFYKSISFYYDYIFPFKPAQKAFVNELLHDTKSSHLLDVGCGTGSLCIELADDFKSVKGIDPDKNMLEVAKKKAGSSKNNLQFLAYGMLEIEKAFDPETFDAILCFGNTLVHLQDDLEILNFLKSSKKLLTTGGKLLIQIINYDRILDQSIAALPTIENEHIRFIRNYVFNRQKNIIDFATIFHIRGTEKSIRNTIQLHPIQKTALENLLKQAGFKILNSYSDFKRSPFHKDSIPLILEVQK